MERVAQLPRAERPGITLYGIVDSQCKKGRNPLGKLPDDFLAASKELLDRNKVFLFAYGGCPGCSGMTVVTGGDIRKWFALDAKGQQYCRLVNGTGAQRG